MTTLFAKLYFVTVLADGTLTTTTHTTMSGARAALRTAIAAGLDAALYAGGKVYTPDIIITGAA